MNKNNKNIDTKRKIIDAAIEEFSEKIYANSSINSICKRGGISKGIVYHYFDSKEELYLYCVEESFNAFAEYIEKNLDISDESINKNLEQYFSLSHGFYFENPVLYKLFRNSVVNFPRKLEDGMKVKRKKFDELNTYIIKTLLSKIELKEGYEIDDLASDFRLFQDCIRIKYKNIDSIKFDIKNIEEEYKRWINIYLYGVVK